MVSFIKKLEERGRVHEMSAIGVLVVDSGAFIKGALLEKWSENVVTVREVVSEIRDVNTRRRLQVLPYDLSFREPSQEALHHGERWEMWVLYWNVALQATPFCIGCSGDLRPGSSIFIMFFDLIHACCWT